MNQRKGVAMALIQLADLLGRSVELAHRMRAVDKWREKRADLFERNRRAPLHVDATYCDPEVDEILNTWLRLVYLHRYLLGLLLQIPCRFGSLGQAVERVACLL